MFDKRLLALIGKKNVLMVAGSAALRWAALVALVVFVSCLGGFLQDLLGDAAQAAARARFFLLVSLVCASAIFACECGARVLGSRAASQAKLTVRAEVYRKLVNLGSAFEERMGAAQACSLMGEGAEKLELYVGRYLPQFFYAVIATLTVFVALAPICLPAATAMLACDALIPVCIVAVMRRAKRNSALYWGSYIDLGALFHEAVSGLATLRLFEADGAWQAKLDAAGEEFRANTMRLLRVQLRSVAIMDFFTYAGSAAGIIVALCLHASGTLDFAGGFCVCTLALQLFLPMRRLGSLFHTGMDAQAVIDQVFDLLECQEPPAGAARVEAGDQADVACEGLCYSYDGRDAQALHEVGFAAEAGSYIGVTGVSGSGKSTLARILSGRAQGYTGSVRIGGIEAREIGSSTLNKLVSYVTHDAHVFAGDVRSNMLLAKPDATDAQIWTALHKSRLDKYVVSLGGLDAPIAEGGSNLSGGQRQRLAFARALMHDTPIYVFDEATSNIDAESESDLLGLVAELALTKTVILISHRLSALQWCDRIYVLEQGRVAQSGPHAALVRTDGAYARLWAQQRRLEAYARKAEVDAQVVEIERKTVAANPITDEMLRLTANMPARVRELMFQAIEMRPVRDLIAGSDGTASGHPSWIPKASGEGRPAAAAAATAEKAQAQAGAGGDSAPSQDAGDGRRRANPDTAAGRGTLKTLAGLLAVTRSQLPALLKAVVLGLVAAGGALALIPLGVCGMAGGATGASGMPALGVLCIVIAACGLVRGPARYGERLATHDQTFRTLADLRSQVFRTMRRLAPAKLQGKGTGELVSLLTSDIELLEGFFSRACTPVVVCACVCAAAIGAIAVQSRQLALAALTAFLLCGVALPLLAGRLTARPGREIRERAVAMESFLLENLKGLSVLMQFGRAHEQAEALSEHLGKMAAGDAPLLQASAPFAGAGQAVMVASCAGIAALGSSLVAGGAAEPLACCVAVALVLACAEPLCELCALGTSLHQSMAAAQRVLDVLREKPAAQDPARAQALQQVGSMAQGPFVEAALENVSFSHDGKPVLENVTLSVQAGQIARIVGPSGAGKSTACKLMMRFWDPDEGRVTLNGEDVREFPLSELHGMQGYMAQETFVFDATLRENVALARSSATQEQVEQACEMAALGELVARLPQGLDTPIAPRTLSDGERQRVGLARIFLHDAPLLILDEPTSNLDALNEAAVLQALETHRQGKAVLIVSHRPSAAAVADVTYVLNANVCDS